MDTKVYKVNSQNFNYLEAIDLIGKQFSGYSKEFEGSETREYFDTFDLRLIKNNFIFSKYKTQYYIEEIDSKTQESIVALSFRSAKKLSKLEDLPEKISDRLSSCLDIRAFFQAMILNKQIMKYSFYNSDKKIIIRIQIEKVNLKDLTENNELTLISLIPLKGYEKKLDKCEEIIKNEIQLEPIDKKKLIVDFIDKAGKIPVNYSVKPIFNISSEMSSFSAVKEILRTLINIAVLNEDGIISDYDPEFLHDYRVSMRKTRSVLGQLKNVFDTEKLEIFRKNITDIASKTNALRDMDVYLMSKSVYEQMLPDHLHQELEVFFKDVSRKKRKAHRQVSHLLKSNSYHNAIDLWKEFLSSNEDTYKGIESDVPVIDIAKKYIYKRFSSILKKGNALQKNSNDADFHKVRINCKKLRYLLELFSSLFPEDDINIVVKQLKNIQDSLGNFNDMSVQEIHLNDYLHSLKGRKIDNTKIAAAIGGLVTSCYNRKIEYRIEFLERFTSFTSKENIKLIEKLFKKSK